MVIKKFSPFRKIEENTKLAKSLSRKRNKSHSSCSGSRERPKVKSRERLVIQKAHIQLANLSGKPNPEIGGVTIGGDTLSPIS